MYFLTWSSIVSVQHAIYFNQVLFMYLEQHFLYTECCINSIVRGKNENRDTSVILKGDKPHSNEKKKVIYTVLKLLKTSEQVVLRLFFSCHKSSLGK